MAITNARMQMRRGLEADFDPDKMQPGEWAVSLDKKYVRMCFSVGVCVRMATYDAFEEDMAQIEEILSTCETIEEAVVRINAEVSENAQAVVEYTEQAKKYRDEAKAFRDEAEQFAQEGYAELQETVASNTAKIDTIIEKAELNIKNTAKGKNLHLTDSANGKAVDFGLYGKAEQKQYSGKNLLENTAESKTKNGVTFTVNEDKSVTANGTVIGTTDGRVYFNINLKFKFTKAGTYILNGCPSGGSSSKWRLLAGIKYSDGTYFKDYIDYGSGVQFEVTQEMIDSSMYAMVMAYIYEGVSANNITFYPMLRLASITDSTYEPYVGGIASPNPDYPQEITVSGSDGSVEVVTENEDSAQSTTVIIPTPNGLCGIKVSSGGNYTDENGQQWICDEVVKYADGSGKKIERIKHYSLAVADMNNQDDYPGWYGISDLSEVIGSVMGRINTPLMLNVGTVCNANTTSSNVIYLPTGTYGMTQTEWKEKYPDMVVEIYLAIIEPIITDLSAEEITEIEKLHTFYPVTNISNDAECGMSITYFADAKNYIDQRLALIESAMLNNI